jgi:transcription elongation factor SPT5
MEKDTFTILDPYGNQQRIKQQQIQFKRDSTRAVTSDVNGKPVAQKDDVVVLDDQGSNRKQATVIHIYRAFVFLKAKETVDSTGVFVTKNTNIALISNKGTSSQPIFAQPMGRPRGRDNLMAKTVTITGGPFKGYLGIVKDTTDSQARIELHTNNRVITVDKTRLNVVGSNGSNGPSRPDYESNNRYGYEARTPMHGSGAKTPAASHGDWNGGGSRTPAWNSGSKTPAWDSGSKTPAWDSGSKTPAWDSGARTPAWDGASGTPSRNRFNNPDTPAVPNSPYEDANTPYTNATPAAYPATPGGRYPSMNSVAAPATPYDHGTPMNPAAPTPTEYHQESRSVSWITDGILVEITNGKYKGQSGSCKIVENGRASIHLTNGDAVMLGEDSLKPVVPQKRDGFKVLKGEYRGNIGHLLSIDGDEGVVKIEGNDEILMLHLDSLAKLAQ